MLTKKIAKKNDLFNQVYNQLIANKNIYKSYKRYKYIEFKTNLNGYGYVVVTLTDRQLILNPINTTLQMEVLLYED